VVRQTHEVANNVGRKKRDVLGTQKGNQKRDNSFFDELDPEGDVADDSDEVLDQAPWTDPPPYDDNDLARLFGDEPETEDRPIASDLEVERVGMTEDEAVAAILRAFPGAELVDEEMLGEHGAKPIADLYHCFYCGASVTPAPASVEHGWSTVCRPCSEAGR
jgi:hypothetical protein